jgi:Icc-related predicted phosphoesterase
MKIAVFSDTHTKHKQVELPECDIAIFAGDFTSVGHKHEVESFLNWYGKQYQCKQKVFIAGNHDKSFDKKFFHSFEDHDLFKQNEPLGKPGWLIDMLDRARVVFNIQYLENSSVMLEGLKIWGSPITPSFFRQYWAFNADRNEEIQSYWNKIPKDANIIVTHGPVHGKLDYIPESSEYVGCVDLKAKIEEINPMMFICGHIHSGRGIYNTDKTLYVNASIMDNQYNKQGEPMLFNVDVDKLRVDFS